MPRAVTLNRSQRAQKTMDSIPDTPVGGARTDGESEPEGKEAVFRIGGLNDINTENGVCSKVEENESCIIYEISRIQNNNKTFIEKGKTYSVNSNNQSVNRLLGAGPTPTVAVVIKSKLSGKVEVCTIYGTPDTGASCNMISLKYAKELGLNIRQAGQIKL